MKEKNKIKSNELYIGVKNLDSFIRVSRATFYKIANNETGEYDGKYKYVVSLQTLKKFPKLYNRYRRTL